ncbi:MAG: hypothetical protein ACN6O3_20585 [Comamonas sp.]
MPCSAHTTCARHLKKIAIGGLLAAALSAALLPAARAQSDASLLLSALPVASVVVAGSAAAQASVAVAALSLDGAVLLVKGVQASAKGTVLVLERVSDGAVASVEIAAAGASVAAASVGATVAVSVIGAGAILSVAGEAIAFVPNKVGEALLYNERL